MIRVAALFNPFVRTSAAKIKIQSVVAPNFNLTYLLSVGSLGISTVLLLSYILGVNSYTSTGFEIKQLQNKLAEITAQNRKVTLQISEVSSIVKIQTDFSNTNFVAAGTPKYLQQTNLAER